jgi:hypothetical protein
MFKKIFLITPFILVTNLLCQVTQEWVSIFNNPKNYDDFPNSMSVDDSGNVYVTGQSNFAPGISDYVTLKYNSTGSKLWIAYYNGNDNKLNCSNAIALKNNCVYVTGASQRILTGFDLATIKYNSLGSKIWVQVYNSNFNQNDVGKFIALDDSENVYVAGVSNSDIIIIKYNSIGRLQWVKNYNGPGNGDDDVYSMQVDKWGNLICGSSDGNAQVKIMLP